MHNLRWFMLCDNNQWVEHAFSLDQVSISEAMGNNIIISPLNGGVGVYGTSVNSNSHRTWHSARIV